MAYVPVATDASQPDEDKFVESAALEFRTLKARVNQIEIAAVPNSTGPAVRSFLKAETRVVHKNFAYDYVTNTIVVRNGASDNLHRHFGGIAEGVDGRLHMTYRRAPIHGVTSGANVYYCYSDDGGKTWSAEVAIVASEVDYDNREQSICVTPSGRILVIYNRCKAPAAAPTDIKLIYSDDNGATWINGGTILSVPFAYARTYGRIKLLPGGSTAAYRLVFTPYYQISATPTYKIAAWYSADDGLTWAEGTPLMNAVNGNSECEVVAINAQIWFGVARGSGLNIYKSTDGGVTWTDVGQVPTSDGVAPTLDKFEYKGKWYVLLCYCDRGLNHTVVRVAPVDLLLTSPTTAFGRAISVSTDMTGASGYQSTVVKLDGTVYIDGGTAYIEFKEYGGGLTYSDVRFIRIDLFNLLRTTPRSLTVAAGVITVPSADIEPNFLVSTEGGAATDDLDTINGGEEGQIISFTGATSGSDVIFKNGTGNLELINDFRLNTAGVSKITLQKAGSKWIELGRTNDYASPVAVIAGGVITVPNATVPIQFAVDTEGSAATDDLDTINGGLEGQLITIFTNTASRDVTVKDGTGNLNLAGDFLLSHSVDRIMLQKQSTLWLEVSRSDNG